MGIDLRGRGWATPETREAPADARHVKALRSSLTRTNGGERVPAGSIRDTARAIAPAAEALEKKGERAAARAAREILKPRLASLSDFQFPAKTDFEERLKTAPHAGSDDMTRRIYG